MGLADTAAYVWNGLRDSWDDAYWWRERVLEFLVGPFHTNVYPRRDGAIRVMDEDWDTLVLLDACRTDLFEQVADRDAYDDYRRVTSRGSTTREWVRQNFTGGEFGDTVYVTANPYVSREAGDAFHRLIEVWDSDFDEAAKTVHPEAVVEAAVEAHREYPDKRVIVHLMQPHHPFVGEHELAFAGWQIEGETHGGGGADASDAGAAAGDTGRDESTKRTRPYTPWDALWMGAVDRDDLWRAYGDNLRLALDALDDLLAEIEGRVVLTSDHGNMLGERTFPIPLRVYGHPKGVRNRELVEVPWATLDVGERRTVRAGETASVSEGDAEELEERLADLGYV